jgi:hypothetical protein
MNASQHHSNDREDAQLSRLILSALLRPSCKVWQYGNSPEAEWRYKGIKMSLEG